VGALGLIPLASALTGTEVSRPHAKAQLLSEVASIGAGQAFWVVLELDIRPGWHTYWRNPGDSGKPTALSWQLPPGFAAGPIIWAAPHRFDLPPLVNYGYAGKVMHLVKITAPASLHAGATTQLNARADWLVCADVCIPESAHLSLKLPVARAPGPPDPDSRDVFAAARAELPKEAPAAVVASDREGRLILAPAAGWAAEIPRTASLAFFPYEQGLIDGSAQQITTDTSGAAQLVIPAGYRLAKADSIRGVLVVTPSKASSPSSAAYEIDASLQH
jgi:DsbC/DsbD-like thiol-disulfide interchange protein